MKKAAVNCEGVTTVPTVARLPLLASWFLQKVFTMNIRFLVLFALCSSVRMIVAAAATEPDPVQMRLELLWQLEAPQGFGWKGSNKPKRREGRKAKWRSFGDERKRRLAFIAFLMNEHKTDQAKGPFCTYSLSSLGATLSDEPFSGVWMLNVTPGADRTQFWRLVIATFLERGAPAVLSNFEKMPINTSAEIVIREEHLAGKVDNKTDMSEWVVVDDGMAGFI